MSALRPPAPVNTRRLSTRSLSYRKYHMDIAISLFNKKGQHFFVVVCYKCLKDFDVYRLPLFEADLDKKRDLDWLQSVLQPKYVLLLKTTPNGNAPFTLSDNFLLNRHHFELHHHLGAGSRRLISTETTLTSLWPTSAIGAQMVENKNTLFHSKYNPYTS